MQRLVVDDLDMKAVNALLAKRRERRETPAKPCGCGCGTLIPELSVSGHPRRYVTGHQHRLTAKYRNKRVVVLFTEEERRLLKVVAKARGFKSPPALIRHWLKEAQQGGGYARH